MQADEVDKAWGAPVILTELPGPLTLFLSHRPALIGIILLEPGGPEGGIWTGLVGDIKLLGLSEVVSIGLQMISTALMSPWFPPFCHIYESHCSFPSEEP